MPLKAVTFTHPDDVYKFLAQLKERGLINFSDDTDKIEGDLDKLTKNLIIGSDQKTYFLPDLMDLSNDEKLLSRDLLCFNHKKAGEPVMLFPHGSRLETENDKLIHNAALAKALLNLNPRRDKLLNEKSLRCADPEPDALVPFIDTTNESTEECVTLGKRLAASNGKVRSTRDIGESYRGFIVRKNDGLLTKYYALDKRYFLNSALSDLQAASRMQMQEYLLQLSQSKPETRAQIVEVLEKNKRQVTAGLAELKDQINKFKEKYTDKIIPEHLSEANKKEISDMESQNKRLREDLKFRLQTIKKRREFYSNVNCFGGVACLVLVGIPVVVYGGIQQHKSTKELHAIEGEIDAALNSYYELFLQNQVSGIYTKIVKPAEELSEKIQKSISVDLPPFQSSKSALIQNSAIAKPATKPANSELELAPSMSLTPGR